MSIVQLLDTGLCARSTAGLSLSRLTGLSHAEAAGILPCQITVHLGTARQRATAARPDLLRVLEVCTMSSSSSDTVSSEMLGPLVDREGWRARTGGGGAGSGLSVLHCRGLTCAKANHQGPGWPALCL